MPISSLMLAALALAAVLGLIWAAQYLARGRLAALLPKPGGRLALVQSLALDQRRRLHLVSCDGRHLLVLTGGGQDVVVGWLPSGEAAS